MSWLALFVQKARHVPIAVGSPVEDRLVRKLNASLNQHEVELARSTDLWKKRWSRFQGLRIRLATAAKGLCRNKEMETETAEGIGAEIAQGVLESRFTGRKPWTVLVEDREGGPAALLVDKGAARIDVSLGTHEDMEQWRQVYESVRKELSTKERLRKVEYAYEDLLDSVGDVEDLVDALVLRGQPLGTCSLCRRSANP